MAGRRDTDRRVLLSDAALERPRLRRRAIAAAGVGHSAGSLRGRCRRACRHLQAIRRAAPAPRRGRHRVHANGDRPIWSAAVIGSPLATTTVFTIGPVSITEPVVVTWGLMAALALGGWLATRSLTVAPSRSQT